MGASVTEPLIFDSSAANKNAEDGQKCDDFRNKDAFLDKTKSKDHSSRANPPTQHFCGQSTPFFPIPRQVKMRSIGSGKHKRCQNLLISKELLESSRNVITGNIPSSSKKNLDQTNETIAPKRPKKRRRI